MFLRGAFPGRVVLRDVSHVRPSERRTKIRNGSGHGSTRAPVEVNAVASRPRSRTYTLPPGVAFVLGVPLVLATDEVVSTRIGRGVGCRCRRAAVRNNRGSASAVMAPPTIHNPAPKSSAIRRREQKRTESPQECPLLNGLGMRWLALPGPISEGKRHARSAVPALLLLCGIIHRHFHRGKRYYRLPDASSRM